MEEKKPRIVELGATSGGGAGGGFGPPILPPGADERLEELLKQANLLAQQDNNQAGQGKKNPSKAVRAERRAKKLARKKNRYR